MRIPTHPWTVWATGDGIGKQSRARGQILINFSFSNDCVAHRGVVVVAAAAASGGGVGECFYLISAGVLFGCPALCGLFDDGSPSLLIMLCM